jgi:Protein of unknown function (DUF4231)
MDDAEFETYYKNRYESELHWYERRSAQHKRGYVILRMTTLVLSASIPAALNILTDSKAAATILAAGLIVCEGTLSLFQLHENWINYRSTAETLKKEAEFFRARIGDYATAEDARKLFVERIEATVSREHTFWRATAKKAAPGKAA